LFTREPIFREGPQLLKSPYIFPVVTPHYWGLTNIYEDQNLSMVELPTAEPLFEEIERRLNENLQDHNDSKMGRFFGSCRGTNIAPRKLKVKRVWVVKNLNLWRRYQLRKKLFREDFPDIRESEGSAYLKDESKKLMFNSTDEDVNEYYLFHGSNPENNSKIINVGIDASFTDPKGRWLGKVMYFSEIASKANQYIPCPDCKMGSIVYGKNVYEPCLCTKPQENFYQILLCRVMLGNIYISTMNEIIYSQPDPLNHLKGLKRESFHSILGEATSEEQKKYTKLPLRFREFGVADTLGQQMYPEFLIDYVRLPE